MARRLVEAKHSLTVFDTQKAAVDRMVALGAHAASSPKDVADRVETVMVSLPSLQVTLDVATGKDGVIEGAASSACSISPPPARRWRCGSMICWPSATSCSSTVRCPAASPAPRRARWR